MTRDMVARSAQIIAKQRALICALEQCGMDAKRDRRLLLQVDYNREMLIEHLRQVEGNQLTRAARHNGLVWPLRRES